MGIEVVRGGSVDHSIMYSVDIYKDEGDIVYWGFIEKSFRSYIGFLSAFEFFSTNIENSEHTLTVL